MIQCFAYRASVCENGKCLAEITVFKKLKAAVENKTNRDILIFLAGVIALDNRCFLVGDRNSCGRAVQKV